MQIDDDESGFDEDRVFVRRIDWNQLPSLSKKTFEFPLPEIETVEVRRAWSAVAGDLLGAFAVGMFLLVSLMRYVEAHPATESFFQPLTLIILLVLLFNFARAPFRNWCVFFKPSNGPFQNLTVKKTRTFQEALAVKDALVIAVGKANGAR